MCRFTAVFVAARLQAKALRRLFVGAQTPSRWQQHLLL
jgi:hypothetical protein